MNTSKLVVSDEYIEDVASYIKKQGDSQDEILTEYIGILKQIADQGITSGKVHDALMAFIEAALKIDGEMSYISSSVMKKLDTFIETVDKKDKYLG